MLLAQLQTSITDEGSALMSHAAVSTGWKLSSIKAMMVGCQCAHSDFLALGSGRGRTSYAIKDWETGHS